MGNAMSEGPDEEAFHGGRYHLGMLSILATTFVALVGQGQAPIYALAMSIIVCVGGNEILGRLPKRDDDDRGGPRWA